jgi:hypothetical protein
MRLPPRDAQHSGTEHPKMAAEDLGFQRLTEKSFPAFLGRIP